MNELNRPRLLVCALSAAIALLACKRESVHREQRSQVVSATAPSSATASADSQPSTKEPPSLEETCEPFAHVVIPNGDEPSREEAAALSRCDAEALYYGIGVPVDFIAARRCAYAQEEQKTAPVIGGAAILMMTYANGNGVPQNLDLALHFACKFGGAEAELYFRTKRLLQARSGESLRAPFDVCDEATSGYLSGYCSANRERVLAVPRAARKRAATANLSKPELAALLSAADAFFQSRTTYEVDLSGTMRSSIQIEEQARLEDDFVRALEQLQNPAFRPLFSESCSEARLSATLTRLNHCKSSPLGTVTRAGSRRVQARWQPYRSAFIALALKTRPDLKRDALQCWINRARLKQLEELLSGC